MIGYQAQLRGLQRVDFLFCHVLSVNALHVVGDQVIERVNGLPDQLETILQHVFADLRQREEDFYVSFLGCCVEVAVGLSYVRRDSGLSLIGKALGCAEEDLLRQTGFRLGKAAIESGRFEQLLLRGGLLHDELAVL